MHNIREQINLKYNENNETGSKLAEKNYISIVLWLNVDVQSSQNSTIKSKWNQKNLTLWIRAPF